MSRFRFWRQLSVALAVAILGVSVSSTAPATLRPAVPLPGPTRVRVVTLSSDSTSSVPEGPGYYYLEPGDSLAFPLAGSGSMRIRSRSIQDREDASGFIRYSVIFGNISSRHWKRISRPQETSSLVENGEIPKSGREKPMVLGEEDVLNLDVPPGVNRVVLRLREGGSRAIVRVFFGDGISQPNHARTSPRTARSPFHGELKLAFGGYDSNAYLSPKDAGASLDRAFWPAALNLHYRSVPSSRFRWEGDYDFAGDFYGDSVLNSHDHLLRFRETWSPETGSWAFGLRQEVEVRRQTFVGRGDTEEFETSAGADTISLGNRFNNLEFALGGFASCTLSSVNDLDFSLAYRYRDYREDYDTYPDIYSLDQTRWELEIALLTQLSPEWRLKSSSDHRWRLYKEKTSRDGNGNTVPGEFSRLSRHRLSLDLARTPREGLEVDLGLEGVVRVDHYDGYWDYSGFGLDGGVGWRWKPGHRVWAGIRYSEDSYDTATVGYVAGGPLRDKTDLKISLDARYRIHRRLDFEVEYDYRDRGNNSPNFAFTRSMLIAGFAIRY